MKKILLCAALLTASAFAAGEFDPNTFKISGVGGTVSHSKINDVKMTGFDFGHQPPQKTETSPKPEMEEATPPTSTPTAPSAPRVYIASMSLIPSGAVVHNCNISNIEMTGFSIGY